MIAVGTEGFFNSTQGAIGTSDDWAYNGADGVDSEHLVQLPNVDFGTFHLYPDWWSKTVGWATNFTIAHANLQHKVGKPIISEEYGWLLEENRRAWLGVNSTIGREEAIGAWQEAGLEHKLAADMYWCVYLLTKWANCTLTGSLGNWELMASVSAIVQM